ncbi:hypothetical protein NIES3974_38060 [Calothrix sp. NIES-3974]|nr:hypothetical protein NIES3974_38060 [Calothrix sp. NIES-3974]
MMLTSVILEVNGCVQDVHSYLLDPEGVGNRNELFSGLVVGFSHEEATCNYVACFSTGVLRIRKASTRK